MTIWIDQPVWPAHDRLWSHLISDTSVAELHAFARAVGLPERSFDGDHYDVPAERYADLVAAGAVPTTGPDLVRRLRASGLRFRKRKGERLLTRVEDGLASATAARHILDVVASTHERSRAGAAVVLISAADRMVLVQNISRPGWAPPGGKREGQESVREGATREVAEETGLVLDPEQLQPVGFERITVPVGGAAPPFGEGDNHIQVYGVTMPRPIPLVPDLVEVSHAQWFTWPEAARRSSRQHWWPLIARWWESGR